MKIKLRNIFAVLTVFVFFLSCIGCQNVQNESTPESTSSAASEATVHRTESITIPASVIDLTGVDITAVTRKLGLNTAVTNEDGSCTIHMTFEEKEQICATLWESLNTQLSALPEQGSWPFLDAVTLSDDCSDVTLQTQVKRYNAIRDNAIAESIYLPSLLYLAFTDADPETFVQHFTVIDSSDHRTLAEFDYPKSESKSDVSDTSNQESEIDSKS